MCAFRGLPAGADPRRIASGPGRFAEALGLSLDDDGRSLFRGSLTLWPAETGAARPRIEAGPRVGITQAADLPYRFFDPTSDCLSRRVV